MPRAFGRSWQVLIWGRSPFLLWENQTNIRDIGPVMTASSAESSKMLLLKGLWKTIRWGGRVKGEAE